MRRTAMVQRHPRPFMEPDPLEAERGSGGINADLGRFAVVHTARVDWQPSPSPSVWRKRLDLTGDPERSRVTSVVRYDPNSKFPSHPHPDGEEILVLDGVFSDEHGDYGAGSYLLNPEGFSHAPFSLGGCTLFVKLRQYPGPDRRRIRVDTLAGGWRSTPDAGVRAMTLYEEEGFPEVTSLLRLEPGGRLAARPYPKGAEIFLIDGQCRQADVHLASGSWARYPAGTRLELESDGGCKLYLKTGHLPAREIIGRGPGGVGFGITPGA